VSVFKYAIALTGGIATGKSSAAKLFGAWGFDIIDLDTIAHRTLDEQQGKISELFGATCITGGRVDRKALGKQVFADTEKRKKLEALLHPLIRQEAVKKAHILDAFGTPYLVDIPLFFELHSYPITRSIVVYTPREIQLQRLMQRDGYSMQEATQRIDAQMNIETKKQQATFVIDNSGDLAQLERECRRVRGLIQSSET
jgi:dephospho-CoA kinase